MRVCHTLEPSPFRRIPLRVYGTSGWDRDAFLMPGVDLDFDQIAYRNFPLVAYGSKPSWSASGARVLFNHVLHAAAERAIWIVPISGGLARPFIDPGHDAVWSPRKPLIAFVRGGP